MKKIIILLCFTLIFLSGCPPSNGPKEVNVHVGTQGLEMGFFERAPPNEVFEGELFNVILEMYNLGAYDIRGGIYSLGIEETYLSADETFDQFNVFGKSVFTPFGDRTEARIPVFTKDLDPQTEVITSLITATACYSYKTQATAEVCIDTDIYGLRQAPKVCLPQPFGLGGGQGTPVALTLIEPRMLPHENPQRIKPQFTITIQNVGNGRVVMEDKIVDACSGLGIKSEELNVMTADVWLFDKPLDCTPKPEFATGKTALVKLKESTDVIKCTLNEGIPTTEGNYLAPLRVELSYGYTFTISKNVMIKKAFTR